MAKSTLLIALLALLLCAAAGAAGYEWLRTNELQAALDGKSFSLTTAQKQIDELEKRLQELRQKLDTASNAPRPEPAEKTETEDMAASDETAPDSSPNARASRDAERRERFRQMVNGPTGEFFATSGIAMRYGDLFKQMKLTPAEKDQLRQILVNAQLSRMRDGRDAASQQTTDAQIKSLLGDARYAEYQTYNSQSRERSQVSQFETTLSLGNSPLTSEQKTKMVQILSSQNTGDTQSLSNQLGSVLTPEQLTQFNKWQSVASQLQRNRGRGGPGGPP